MTAPRVSVLLPVHDAEATLPACLRSIQRQSEPAWECIAVDDGSTDASGRILAIAADADARIRVVSTPHRGIVAALNAGLEACRAPLVARMDADDWMHRDRLAAQRALFDGRPALVAVGARVRIFPRAGLREGRRTYEAWLNAIDGPRAVRCDAFVECPIAHPTLMIRTHALRTLGYRDRGWPEDYDLVLRLLAAGHELDVHPKRLLGWRDTPERLSRRSPDYAQDRFTACKAEHLATHFLRGSSRYVLWGYGSTGRALRRALLDHGKQPSHIVELHPRRIGQSIHGAPVVHPDALRDMRDCRLIASVSGHRPRTDIRRMLEALGFEELRNFVCAA